MTDVAGHLRFWQRLFIFEEIIWTYSYVGFFSVLLAFTIYFEMIKKDNYNVLIFKIFYLIMVLSLFIEVQLIWSKNILFNKFSSGPAIINPNW